MGSRQWKRDLPHFWLLVAQARARPPALAVHLPCFHDHRLSRRDNRDRFLSLHAPAGRQTCLPDQRVCASPRRKAKGLWRIRFPPPPHQAHHSDQHKARAVAFHARVRRRPDFDRRKERPDPRLLERRDGPCSLHRARCPRARRPGAFAAQTTGRVGHAQPCARYRNGFGGGTDRRRRAVVSSPHPSRARMRSDDPRRPPWCSMRLARRSRCSIPGRARRQSGSFTQ